MPATFHPNVIGRAKELWTSEGGYSPRYILDMLGFELKQSEDEWTKNLPAGNKTRLPKDRSTIRSMAKKFGWPPRQNIKKSEVKEEPESYSGIADPIWHLSKLLAERKANEYANHDGELSSRRATLIQQVIAIEMDVAYEYNPHPKMFERLRPLIKQWLIQERKRDIQFRKKLEDATEILPDGTIRRDMGFIGGEN